MQNHCYRADEMAQMIDISHEFGFHITPFTMRSEGYKIADSEGVRHLLPVTWAELGRLQDGSP